MAIVRYQTPFSAMTDLRREINSLFDYGFSRPDSDTDSSMTTWRPSVDVKEEDDKYIFHADIPGMDAKDIKLSFDNKTLSISGDRQTESMKDGERFQRVERVYGSFCRQFTLPDNVDKDNISAKSKHGVLEITIPKKEQEKEKYIEIQVED